ncbi:MAG: c-type cytochrome biogenesis protein CcmI [Rhodospirillales bacterium]|nr:c-type cytochrome biogenesis protein CcmI [Rhodospirillales bacterium]
MIGFWIAAAVFLLVTLGIFLRVMLRPPSVPAADAERDLAVYRDQLAEVDRDLERGILAEDEADAARIEIKRRLLAAADAGELAAATARPVPPALRGATITMIALLVPAGALGVYLYLGSPTVPDQPLASRSLETQTVDQEQLQRHEQMADLTARLAAQLEENPNQPEGWLLLGRSYRTVENYGGAVAAFERALELIGRDPTVLSEYGEILVLAHGGTVSEPALAVFRETVELAPSEPRARYYLGAHRAQEGDAHGAIQEWTDLIAVSAPDAPWLGDVRNRIRVAASAAGIDVATITPSEGLPPPPPPMGPPAAQPPQPSAPPAAAESGLSADDMQAAAEMTPEERQEMIRSMVEGLAERLKDEPDDADGWRRLARAYRVLGEIEKAADAIAAAEAAEARSR